MGIKGEWKFVQPQIGGVNAYQYNGKELNEDYGLNWNDYGARWYDASIGRWNGIDPLAVLTNEVSPYAYVSNNPILMNDPTGMIGEKTTEGLLNDVWNKTPNDGKVHIYDNEGNEKGSNENDNNKEEEEDCCPQWLVNAARGIQGAIAFDATTPDPSDGIGPKWLVEGGLLGISGLILYFNGLPPTIDLDQILNMNPDDFDGESLEELERLQKNLEDFLGSTIDHDGDSWNEVEEKAEVMREMWEQLEKKIKNLKDKK
jgi:RHS repeat-associated protein